MEKEYEIAPFSRRLGATFIDYILIFLVWYMITVRDLESVNSLLETLDPNVEGSLDIFVEAIFKMYIAFIFKYIFVKTFFYVVPPAIIGKGKTLGKLLFGLSMVDYYTLKEIKPIRLIYREFVIRGLLETLLIIPNIVTIVFVLFTKKSRGLHDRICKTIVIRDRSFIEEE